MKKLLVVAMLSTLVVTSTGCQCGLFQGRLWPWNWGARQQTVQYPETYCQPDPCGDVFMGSELQIDQGMRPGPSGL